MGVSRWGAPPAPALSLSAQVAADEEQAIGERSERPTLAVLPSAAPHDAASLLDQMRARAVLLRGKLDEMAKLRAELELCERIIAAGEGKT